MLESYRRWVHCWLLDLATEAEEGTRLDLRVLEPEDKAASFFEVHESSASGSVSTVRTQILERNKCLDCKCGSAVGISNSKMYLQLSNHKTKFDFP
ncbi:hypothetical protein DVH24_016193 [Malus domestica]|uniref:Uncharacterized protein n=1 Tax=Malus domestica TaxID=3750 RepID=A0A498JG60_MALDO|nr:hypothetical protein DVH24_016193 [Malus domestica]